jgi:hypothetical protein
MQEWRTDEELAQDRRLLSPLVVAAGFLLLVTMVGVAVAVITLLRSL